MSLSSLEFWRFLPIVHALLFGATAIIGRILVARNRHHRAVEMFLDHASCIDLQFGHDEASVRLISQICQRLDGLPLAIEIAAARAAVLGSEALAEAIGDRF